jgi:hypothetical protein
LFQALNAVEPEIFEWTHSAAVEPPLITLSASNRRNVASGRLVMVPHHSNDSYQHGHSLGRELAAVAWTTVQSFNPRTRRPETSWRCCH